MGVMYVKEVKISQIRVFGIFLGDEPSRSSQKTRIIKTDLIFY